jgi:2-polyprenyl-6-methoxyphenol hydroxylase-like FAD-dependent oxidoreductase
LENVVRTVIVGAGPAGLFTAIALAHRGRQVVVVDRDAGPPGSGVWNRRGVMQFHHAHTFRGPVIEALNTEMPTVLSALTAAGAEIVTTNGGAPVALLCRRSMLERVLRRHAEAQPGITLVTGHVDDVLRERGRAVGVAVQGRQLAAGMVINASGRASRVLRDLRGAGEGGPCGAAYVSRQYRLLDGAVRGPVNSPVGLSLGFAGYFAVVFLHDNRTFSITITHDGTDHRLRRLRYTGVYEAAVRAIPQLADWIEPGRATPISPVLPGGRLYNTYRGQLDAFGRPILRGLLSVGDAVCTTTPLAGRGVALAFPQAAELVRLLATYPDDVVAATVAFDAWCSAHIRPWFDDHMRSDTDRMRRWAGGDIDLNGPLPSDLIVAAANADPALRALVGPYDSMRALPDSLAPLQAPARAIYESGWRPAVPEGLTRTELGKLCAEHSSAEIWGANPVVCA